MIEGNLIEEEQLGHVRIHFLLEAILAESIRAMGFLYASLITTITPRAFYLFHSKSAILYFVCFFLPSHRIFSNIF